ncbi:MAG: DUF2652 domain-containing protein [Candidatus Lambdaproteobacteria bacterium]|nr:DUF2652 domain-containing protein [Candidatus Lambdaproteobacteria bacterium]
MAFRSGHGLLLIPDISGYTDFISSVELAHGQHIIAELLETLIDGNELGLELSEVEGDALLFYRVGERPAPDRIVAQATGWFAAFHEHLARLRQDIYCTCGACQNLNGLTLKIVGHYGEIGVHRVGKATKLIGKDVVLAHRLLKNRLERSEYLLLTEDAFAPPLSAEGPPQGFQQHSEEYPVLGIVRGLVMDLAAHRQEGALAGVRAPRPEAETDNHFETDVRIRARLAEVVPALIEPENWSKWFDGVELLHYDRTEPLRAGHHHVCLIEGQRIEQTLEHLDRRKGEVAFTFRMKPPMGLLTRMYRVVRARQEPDGVLVTQSLHYVRRPLVGWLFDRMALPMLERNFRRSLGKLKAFVEHDAAVPGQSDPAAVAVGGP